jgi:hypothetical protein
VKPTQARKETLGHGLFLVRTLKLQHVRLVRLTVTGIDSAVALTDWVSIVESRVCDEWGAEDVRCRAEAERHARADSSRSARIDR